MSIRGSNSSDSETNSDLDSITSNRSRSPIKRIFTKPNRRKMTENQITILRKEYLDMITEFSGETQILSTFLKICEKLLNKFYNNYDVGDFQNEYLMSTILSKIKGSAAINISSCIIRT